MHQALSGGSCSNVLLVVLLVHEGELWIFPATNIQDQDFRLLDSQILGCVRVNCESFPSSQVHDGFLPLSVTQSHVTRPVYTRDL
jgi:hypothetical protein